MKEIMKQKIREFWETHKDFNDRNPDDIRDAENLNIELLNMLDIRGLPHAMLIGTVEELQKEAEIATKKAREEFYRKI